LPSEISKTEHTSSERQPSMSRRPMTVRCPAGSCSIAAAINCRASAVNKPSPGVCQAVGADAQCPGQRSWSARRKRSGSTAVSPSAASRAAKLENGTERRSRDARVLATLVGIRKIQVFSEERPSKRSNPRSTLSHVFCTTSSATARLPT
jgi:hypothetical protein